MNEYAEKVAGFDRVDALMREAVQELTLSPEALSYGIGQRKLLSHISDKRVTFETILPFLPEKVSSFLDIGCGYGAVALHIARHYQTAVCNLIEGEAADNGKQTAGWNENCEPWRSVHLAAAIVRSLWGGQVSTFPPDPALTIPCDLIVSTWSWGHHYPIPVYLPLVQRSLRPGGVVITDIRKNTQGRKQLEAVFAEIEVIEDRSKLERVACRGMRA